MAVVKFLFFDYRDFEGVDGFQRRIEPPHKSEHNPILVSDDPVEDNRLLLYGSVLRHPDTGRWQMWYESGAGPKGIVRAIGYVESDDGITWRRPQLDIVPVGEQRTHLLFDQHPVGTTVIYDEREERPGWQYKLLVGSAPLLRDVRISAFRSPDGIHWLPAAENPVIGTNPDCPMSLHRANDGRYTLYVRASAGDRRVARRESWDFVHWTEPRIVLDQEPRDHPQVQLYGMGAVPYGSYEIGTLWVYETDPQDMGFNKMFGHQYTELAYTRSGYTWHRAELGTPWIARGTEATWDWGNIQAASAPVFLEDEIRFYYAGTRARHGISTVDEAWPPKACGIGFASMLPDRFVGVTAQNEGHILTRPFWTTHPEFFMNASVARGGRVMVEVDGVDGTPIEGFELANGVPVEGDSTRHPLRWHGSPNRSALANRMIRLRVRAQDATIYALASGAEDNVKAYWRFRIPHFHPMERETMRRDSWDHDLPRLALNR